jgi:hypothetical protein
MENLSEHPDANVKHVAEHYGISRNALYIRMHHKTQEPRGTHPQETNLTVEEKKAAIEWTEYKDPLGMTPKYKELRVMVLPIIKSKRPQRNHLGEHYTARFHKRYPKIGTMVMHTMDWNRVYVLLKIYGYWKTSCSCIHNYHMYPVNY